MKKRDFKTYQKRFWDFEILPKFSETHVFRGTIHHPLKAHPAKYQYWLTSLSWRKFVIFWKKTWQPWTYSGLVSDLRRDSRSMEYRNNMIWVGTVTCCSSPVLLSRSCSLSASGSSVTSIWMLKSLVINRWLAVKTVDSRNSKNSSRKTLVVTGWTPEYGGL